MPKIEMPDGFEGSEQLPRTNRTLQNCFKIEGNRVLARPGITAITTKTGIARGSFEWNGSLYMLFSTSLIKITNVTTGASSAIGTVAGSDNIQVSIGFNFAVIVVPNGNIYTLSKADALVDITNNTNFVACRDVAFMNGRHIYIPFDGDPAFFSDVGAPGTVQALSFFDAEELPDKNNAVFNLNNTLYIMGTDSIQPFRDTGASPNPFTPTQGATIRAGFIGSLLEAANTFYFIGRLKDQSPGIFAIGQGTAPKISNERIDLALSTYTDTELSETIPGRIVWRGHDLATFALRRDSFGFINGNWIVLETIFSEQSKVWGAGFITEFEGTYYTAFEGRIGKFAKVNKDYGEFNTKIIGVGIDDPEDDFASIQSIQLGISQGFNTDSDTGTVAIRMSESNVQFGPEFFLDLGSIGEYTNKIEFNPPGGLGMYHGFAGFEIYCVADIDFSADFLRINAR